jgi:hypothetical protein
VVCHSPCARWGRFWSGGPSTLVRHRLGDDGGCFEAALRTVRTWGGVLEHPEASKAWAWFGLAKPPKAGGWVRADDVGGFTCCVEQGHYGHQARKATWLYVCGVPEVDLPALLWGEAEGTASYLSATKGRRAGACQRLSRRQRTLTPAPFAEVLLGIARLASRKSEPGFPWHQGEIATFTARCEAGA